MQQTPAAPQMPPTAGAPNMQQQMQGFMNMSPDQLQTAMDQMKNIDPTMMESMLKAQGYNMSADQIRMATEQMTPDNLARMQ
jgi:hypothetical protein